jgi:hypothetical protein
VAVAVAAAAVGSAGAASAGLGLVGRVPDGEWLADAVADGAADGTADRTLAPGADRVDVSAAMFCTDLDGLSRELAVLRWQRTPNA